MMQIHFELARAIFSQGGAGRYLLCCAAGAYSGEYGGVLVEVGHRIDLRAELAPPCQRQAWRLNAPLGGALDIDEIELEFDCDYRREPQLVKAFQHIGQDAPRIAKKSLAIAFAHRYLYLRYISVRPRYGQQGVCDWQAGTIGVAVIETKVSFFDGHAANIERKHGSWQQESTFVHVRQLIDRYTLAARYSAEIREQDVDEADSGMSAAQGSDL
jgi:hypothetical protein